MARYMNKRKVYHDGEGHLCVHTWTHNAYHKGSNARGEGNVFYRVVNTPCTYDTRRVRALWALKPFEVGDTLMFGTDDGRHMCVMSHSGAMIPVYYLNKDGWMVRVRF